MEYQDYYRTLGVDKSADAQAIKKAYRKLARKYHPDLSKEADAEARMAAVNEAYAVLSDPEKRKVYDEVGAQAWAAGARSGDDVRPPPGWRPGGAGRTSGHHFSGDEAQFSDFFAQMFGRHADQGSEHTIRMRGQDQHATIELDLLDAYRGAQREISLRNVKLDEQGRAVPDVKTLQISIPKGVREGQLIRLAGHGEPGFGGAPSGDLLLQVEFRKDERWQVEGRDVTQRLRVSPWEAASGAQVTLRTPDSAQVEVTVPPGSGNGRKLRLKGRGIPSAKAPGDLYLALEIAVPGAVTDAQRKAWQALAAAYPGFDPRRA